MDKKASSKQVLLFTLINYIGTAIGIVSVLFIYPNNKAFLGTVRYIDNIAQLLYPIMVLGASQALIKFYPSLDENLRKKLFNYSIFSILFISVVVLIAIPLFVNISSFDNAQILYFAFPVAVSLAFIELFKRQAQDMQKIAVPTLYEKLIPKIVLPILFLLLINDILEVYTSLYFYISGYLLVLVLTAIYLFKRFKPGINYEFKTLFEQIPRKDYLRYSLYAFAGSLGSLLAFRIDGIVIPELISMEANGSFSIGVTLASTLQIPAIGMFAIYAPIVSGYLKNNNIQELNMKYKEVARLLFFIGAVLYSCIFLGVNDLFSLLPTGDSLQASLPIILILGFSVLINMATGFNSEIITYSSYYRFNLIAVVLLTVLNVSLNLWFIYYTNLGIAGVAYASLIAMTIFNIAKLWFIYKKFGLLPFDRAFLKLAVIFLLSGVIIFLLPNTGSNFINLIYKVGLSLLMNVMVIYKLRLVYQVNIWIDKALKIIKLK
ncbi:hypothetical protein DVK85_01760 [Flavobacterium arcticum]|uniref:Uncharacterized protein n=1 Tax=Flavobacterium arcticum TaxID=1784713 RepID=A0A345H8W7_9FLAO|nr:oligosaccharide flippase family protein [Flavobacterium arcticum]AXG73027.1 hypothetical protein DVK85_01760 [Flavobacterium arcticum]KAF2510309.1 oligosaccharide flippase family protein [Flavobacterium arcticum]